MIDEDKHLTSRLQFAEERQERITENAQDAQLQSAARAFFDASIAHKYSYNFTWLGVPIIQYPQDIMAMQEVIWQVKPQLIVETGVAHGGSVVLSASILEMLGGERCVVGIDNDLRPHNRDALEKHPLAHRIKLLHGSSVDETVVMQVRRMAEGKRVLVFLDSNHTAEHVFRELRAYSPMVKKNSYVVVFDTCIEHMSESQIGDRPWRRGNSPATAVQKFLLENQRFVVDKQYDYKSLITVAPGGWLKCVK